MTENDNAIEPTAVEPELVPAADLGAMGPASEPEPEPELEPAPSPPVAVVAAQDPAPSALPAVAAPTHIAWTIARDGEIIRVLGVDGAGVAVVDSYADARVIAMAPTMLELLERAAQMLERERAMLSPSEEYGRQTLSAMLADAWRVIALAKGSAP